MLEGSLVKNLNKFATCAPAGVCNKIVVRMFRGALKMSHAKEAMFAAGALIADGNTTTVWRELLLALFVHNTALLEPSSVHRVLSYYQTSMKKTVQEEAGEGDNADKIGSNQLDLDAFWSSVYSAVTYVAHAPKNSSILWLFFYLCTVHDGSVPTKIWNVNLSGWKMYTDLIKVGAKEAERHIIAYVAETLPKLAVQYSWEHERFVLMCFTQLMLRGHLDVAWQLLTLIADKQLCFQHLRQAVRFYSSVHRILLDFRDGSVNNFVAFGAFDKSRSVLFTALLLFTRCTKAQPLMEEDVQRSLRTVHYTIDSEGCAATHELLECDPMDVQNWQTAFKEYVPRIPFYGRLTPWEVSVARIREEVNIVQHRYDVQDPLKHYSDLFAPGPGNDNPWKSVCYLGEREYVSTVHPQGYILYHTGKRGLKISAVARVTFKLDAYPRRITGPLSSSAPLLESLNAPTLTQQREFNLQQRERMMRERNICEPWMMGFVTMHFSTKPNVPRNLFVPTSGAEYMVSFDRLATEQLMTSQSIPPKPSSLDLDGTCIGTTVTSGTVAGRFEAVQRLRAILGMDHWTVWALPAIRFRPLFCLAQHPLLESEDEHMTVMPVTNLKALMANEPIKFASEVLLRASIGKNQHLNRHSFITNLMLRPEVSNDTGNPHRILLPRDDAMGERFRQDAYMDDDEQIAFLEFFGGEGGRERVLRIATAWIQVLEAGPCASQSFLKDSGYSCNSGNSGNSGYSSLRSSSETSDISRSGSPALPSPSLKRSRNGRTNTEQIIEPVPNLLPTMAATMLAYLRKNLTLMEDEVKWIEFLGQWLSFFCESQ